MGAGDSRQRSDLLAGLPLISKTKRECPVGTPSFVLSGGIAAWGKGLPSVSRLRAGHVPPAPPACGPTPCPPWAAAGPPPAPSSPCGSGRGNVAAGRRLRRLRPSQPPAVARGHPSAMQGQAPAGRADGPALHCSSPAPVAAQVLRGGPAPTSGGFGAVRPSGPVGGASASLASPATPAAQAGPLGSACALAARRSGAAALAAFSGQAGPRPAACGLAPAGARNLYRRAHWRRKRRLPRASRAAGRRGTPPAGGSAGRCPGRQGQGKPRAGRQAAHKRGPCLPVPRPAMGKRGGCPALCGPPAPSHSGKTVVLLCRMLSLVASLLLAGSGGWSAVLVVSLAGLLPGLPGLSGRPRWRRLLPVSWRRLLLRATSGLLVLRSVGWRSCGAGNSRALGAVFAADLGRSGPDRRQV